jgi:hypothetical protein
MDAGGRPGLVWWWWLRQGPRRRRAGAQEQQQSGLAGLESRVRRAAYLRRGPEVQSPMKDKPTTQRPPAGLRIDYPVPPGSGEALARAGARAGPTYAPIQCKSQSTTRLLLLLLLLLGGDRAAAAVARSSRLGPTLNRPKDSARLVGSASNSARARGQERHHQTSQWGKLTACSKEKLSSPLAAAGEEPTGRCELERLVQSTRHLGKSSGGAGGGRGACAAAHCGRRRSGGSAHALSPHPLPTPFLTEARFGRSTASAKTPSPQRLCSTPSVRRPWLLRAARLWPEYGHGHPHASCIAPGPRTGAASSTLARCSLGSRRLLEGIFNSALVAALLAG